jgi:hypothetical protein
MPGGEIDDDDIIDRLGRIFKDMPAYTPCPVLEYSATHPPNEVSSRTQGMYNPQTGGCLQNLDFSIQTIVQTAHTTHRQTDCL